MTALVALVAAAAAAAATSSPRIVQAPSFAAELEAGPAITGPAGWPVIDESISWQRLAAATPRTRQAARWAFARSQIGKGRGSEAVGILSIMVRGDPDLALVAGFRLATAAAAIEVGHIGKALDALDDAGSRAGELTANPEACAWRLRGFAALGRFDAAMGQFSCAVRALDARTVATRAPFLYAVAASALALKRAGLVEPLLHTLPPTDATANLYRGKAALALGNASAVRQLEAVGRDGTPKQRTDAEVSLLEAKLPIGTNATAAQLRQIDHLALAWRGDELEKRVLRLSYRSGVQSGNMRRSLAAGAVLVRHFDLGVELSTLLAALQAALAAGLAPDAAMPLAQAAGLYWDYRDLAPAGAAGDFLVEQLADRLQAGGLYRRAAELLRHQLRTRISDIAQGPLSVRVATFFILAAQPDAALDALKRTDGIIFPSDMLADRHRVEAVALYKLGRDAEALAVLQDVPDAGVIRAEIFWKRREWPALVAETEARLPMHRARLGDVDQAIILRHAIALATLGREAALSALRERYLTAFVDLPGAATFDLLTRAPDAIDAQALTNAMMKLPSASPAGRIGELFEGPGAPSARPGAAT